MNNIQFKQEIFIPSTIEGLNKCLDIVYTITKQCDLDADTSFRLHTVIIEAVENAIIHGNKFIRDSDVRVLIMVGLHEIVLEIEDKGDGFDLTGVSSPLEAHRLGLEGGRGIFFIQRLSLSCYTVGKGNIIRIKLKR